MLFQEKRTGPEYPKESHILLRKRGSSDSAQGHSESGHFPLVLLSTDGHRKTSFQFVLTFSLNTCFTLPGPVVGQNSNCSQSVASGDVSPHPYCSVPLSSQFPLTHTLERICPRPLGLAIPSAWNNPPTWCSHVSSLSRPLLQGHLSGHLLRELPGPPSLELHPHPIPGLPTPTRALFFSMVLSKRSLLCFVCCLPPS